LTVPGLEVRTAVRLGDPATVRLGVERDEGVQLVAMSVAGRSGLQRSVRSSVADAVGRSASVPVLLVRP
jgi:nucleotide-binding universal stress UspA family protein